MREDGCGKRSEEVSGIWNKAILLMVGVGENKAAKKMEEKVSSPRRK